METMLGKKTLGRETTKLFFINRETGYNTFVSRWRLAIRDGWHPTATDLLLYTVLRGKDLSKAFTLITNKVKLENGQNPQGGYNAARDGLNWHLACMWSPASEYRTTFGCLLAPGYIDLVDKLLPFMLNDGYGADYSG